MFHKRFRERMHNFNCGPQAGFIGFGGPRARRGDLGPTILKLLQEKPMHGYEIISQLEEKSHGMWRPSAGAIYPNLQMLEEQGLLVSNNEGGKKIYSLTSEGEEAAKKAEDMPTAPWEHHAHLKDLKDLKGTGKEIMMMLRSIAMEDSEEKNKEVKKILEEAKEKLAKLQTK